LILLSGAATVKLSERVYSIWQLRNVSDFELTAVRKYANIGQGTTMPRTPVVLFRDDDGSVPLLEWLDELPSKVQAKCLLRIERLKEMGHELRRPEADYLRDEIYELRVRHQSVNYRMLYFYHGKTAAVLSHGLQKEQAVPPKDIDLALLRKKKFVAAPKKHTCEE
jgi:phage-related protein